MCAGGRDHSSLESKSQGHRSRSKVEEKIEEVDSRYKEKHNKRSDQLLEWMMKSS